MLEKRTHTLQYGSAVEVSIARHQKVIVVGSDDFCRAVCDEISESMHARLFPIEAIGKLSKSLRGPLIDLHENHWRIEIARTLAKK